MGIRGFVEFVAIDRDWKFIVSLLNHEVSTYVGGQGGQRVIDDHVFPGAAAAETHHIHPVTVRSDLATTVATTHPLESR